MDSTQSNELLIPLLAGLLVSLILMILIIRWAVAPYLNDIFKEIRKGNRLRILQLKKNGVSDEEIRSELDKDNKR